MKLFKNKTMSCVLMICVILNNIRTKQTRMHAYYIIFAYTLKLSEFEAIYYLSCAKKPMSVFIQVQKIILLDVHLYTIWYNYFHFSKFVSYFLDLSFSIQYRIQEIIPMTLREKIILGCYVDGFLIFGKVILITYRVKNVNLLSITYFNTNFTRPLYIHFLRSICFFSNSCTCINCRPSLSNEVDIVHVCIVLLRLWISSV